MTANNKCYVRRNSATTAHVYLHRHFPSKVVEYRFRFFLAKLHAGGILQRLRQDPLILATDRTEHTSTAINSHKYVIKGECNLDIVWQSDCLFYISDNKFLHIDIAFCALLKNRVIFKTFYLLIKVLKMDFIYCNCIFYGGRVSCWIRKCE